VSCIGESGSFNCFLIWFIISFGFAALITMVAQLENIRLSLKRSAERQKDSAA
jgi:uncharacterized membrane protein